ncbi:MAG: hypoxanthine phosphoribosyltransferase [Magnetococcales bacterium]|nr:hypoxanthine phosphoribosyltransferase [Magnetococcales bacterium]MBF0309064.1 hypoxanthine phosphoribosyltransferase [Magnetococcales bacterium]
MDSGLRQQTLLIDREHLQSRIQELAIQIEEDLSSEALPLLVVVLKGGFLFGADLMRALSRPVPVIFAHARAETETFVFTREDLDLVAGRDVIVVDALMDTGGSMKRLLELLKAQDPASMRVAVLLHKTVSLPTMVPVDYLGFEVPDVRLVGYGLDEDQLFRGLDAIFTWWESKEARAFPAEDGML